MRVTTYIDDKILPLLYSRTHTDLLLNNSFRDKTVADIPVFVFLCNK